MKKKSLSVILAVLIAAAIFASCSDSSGSKDNLSSKETDNFTSEDVTAEALPDSLDYRQTVSDDLPTLDFDGREFRIFYQKRYTTDAIPETESETGDVLNDAVYRRNQTVEERFNVKIHGIQGEEDAMVQALIKSVSAGDDAYDLFLGHSIYSSKAALNGYFRNLYDIEYIDFEKPWFPQFAIKGLTINGKMFMSVGDICLSAISNTYCMYFNKEFAANYNVPDLYTTVSDGQWTIDKLAETAQPLYDDINGDTKKDENDCFGFTSEVANHATTWLFSCDVPTIEIGNDGTVMSVFNSERAVGLIEKLRNLYFDNPGTYCKQSFGETPVQMFRDGRILLISGGLIDANKFRDIEFDYGIIPYPKYNEEQENYFTIPGGSVSCLTIPATVTDTVFVGALTTALCRESWVNVVPVYYDIVLKVKGVRDETSIGMLDIITNGRLINATFIYDAFTGYTYKMTELVTSKKDLASFCAANDKRVIAHFEKVVGLFFED